MPTPSAEKRTSLNRERALQAAVELADDQGIDAASMRNLASRRGGGEMPRRTASRTRPSRLSSSSRYRALLTEPVHGPVSTRRAVGSARLVDRQLVVARVEELEAPPAGVGEGFSSDPSTCGDHGSLRLFEIVGLEGREGHRRLAASGQADLDWTALDRCGGSTGVR